MRNRTADSELPSSTGWTALPGVPIAQHWHTPSEVFSCRFAGLEKPSAVRELAWPGGLVLTAGGEGVDARTVDEHVVVVGSGPAGLAAAWAIRRAGVDPLVVDQADSVAASWQDRHDHLRLNTHRMFSHQPGARIPHRARLG
jgi:hypothetical protein